MPRFPLGYLCVTSLCISLACGGSDGASPSPPSLTGKILFIAGGPNGATRADIYAVNPDGRGLTNLTRHPAYYDAPAPSPDGAFFVFYRSAQPSDSGDVFAIDADGTHLRQLTFTPDYESGLAWRHDGKRLAFVRNRDIYTMAPDGSDVTRLTFDATDFKASPAWSPAGDYIAYSRYIDPTAQYDIHRITAAGQNDTTLAALDGDDLTPTWSAAGTSITFAHHESPLSHLYTVDLTTGVVAPVTTGSVIDQWPSISPTGDTVAFIRAPYDPMVPLGPQDVYLLLPGSSTAVPVTSFAATKFAYVTAWTGHP